MKERTGLINETLLDLKFSQISDDSINRASSSTEPPNPLRERARLASLLPRVPQYQQNRIMDTLNAGPNKKKLPNMNPITARALLDALEGGRVPGMLHLSVINHWNELEATAHG